MKTLEDYKNALGYAGASRSAVHVAAPSIITERKRNCVLNLSYGKDSLACLGAIEELGWPLDRIIHAEVWATDTIPADLPPMVEFKTKADAIIKERWGIEVEHIRSAWTYETHFHKAHFYRKRERTHCFSREKWNIWLSCACGAMVQSKVESRGAIKSPKGCRVYIHRDSSRRTITFPKFSEEQKSPLVEANWTEQDCREWCEKNGLLSPIYTDSERGGCWFCHNQGVKQLRLLRQNYPEYWALMMKWDQESPISFHADGHTVHDFDRRFQLEDQGLISPDDRVFRWSMLEEPLNFRFF